MSSYWPLFCKSFKCRAVLFVLTIFTTILIVGGKGDEFFSGTVDDDLPAPIKKPTSPNARSLVAVEEPINGWEGYASCDQTLCLQTCSNANVKSAEAVCDPESKNKVCKCDREKFSHSLLKGQGILRAANSSDPGDAVCSNYCEKYASYGRIWLKNETKAKHCICLTGQMTAGGFTMCDRHNDQKCNEICKNEDIRCSFNGACICRETWPGFFNMTEKYSRAEKVEEKAECENKCHEYNYDWVGRVYDLDIEHPFNVNKVTKFGRKFCLCGEEVVAKNVSIAAKLKSEGFQVCTGLKCKQRCQSVAAHCEPENRRACYCNNQNIFIKKHLWSRLPSSTETMCQNACNLVGLDARVIEWNPFFIPANQRLEPYYRKSAFQYLYDGKFCHCVKLEIKMNQFRPCSDEICEFYCGHHEATCDLKTRRACICNTHKLMLNAGRIPEPSERNCDITCRSYRMTGKVLDVTWKKGVAEWGGTSVNKYCACVRPVSAAGLSHCEPENDMCPRMCEKLEAYCTKEKDCRCGDVSLKNRKNIRRGDYKEWDECSESCRSWMWPLAEDLDNHAWIYDMALEPIDASNQSALIAAKNELSGAGYNDTRDEEVLEEPSFFQEAPGDIAMQAEAMSSWTAPRRFCLCAKSIPSFHAPGFRGAPYMEPMRVSSKMPCINNHTCEIVNSGLEITY